MPYKSLAQARWAHSPSGIKALGKEGVAEWDRATKGKRLPERVEKKAGGGKAGSKVGNWEKHRLHGTITEGKPLAGAGQRYWQWLDFENAGKPIGNMLPRSPRKEDDDQVYAAGGTSYRRSGSFEKSTARGITSGMLNSSVPGRTDKLPIDVSPGSYVLPADIVSSVGQGNSSAGAAILTKMFSGAKMNKYGGGKYRMKGVKGLKRGQFADGGSTEAVPIIAAGGEFVLSPDEVAFVGNGDMDAGNKILDRFVLKQRANHIKTLKNLKPPKEN